MARLLTTSMNKSMMPLSGIHTRFLRHRSVQKQNKTNAIPYLARHLPRWQTEIGSRILWTPRTAANRTLRHGVRPQLTFSIHIVDVGRKELIKCACLLPMYLFSVSRRRFFLTRSLNVVEKLYSQNFGSVSQKLGSGAHIPRYGVQIRTPRKIWGQ